MCGIFGKTTFGKQALNLREVLSSTRAIAHRGPDDEGYLVFNEPARKYELLFGSDSIEQEQIRSIHDCQDEFHTALGFRRLAIIDLTATGHQPMSVQNGRYWIVFNGEIYNHVELRKELSQLGHSFHSNSDTEVLLTAYAAWGAQMLNRLIGMFAFCILDTQLNRLFIARDFFGIKPLYYVFERGCFSFASEIKALLADSGLERKANPQSIYTYLRDGTTDHTRETFYQGIYQLEPGHYFELDLHTPSAPQPKRYWTLRASENRGISFSEAAGELRRLFLENIRLHLRSDVPVGSCLSGGIDSSSVVMGMRAIQGDALSIKTFSYIAAGSSFDEERWVDLVAGKAKTEVHKVRFGAEDLVRDLDRLLAVQEEPFGSTSIYAQYRVFQLAAEAGIRVMEDGQGADELFGGYLTCIPARIASLAAGFSLGRAYRLFRSARQDGARVSMLARRTLGWLMPAELRKMARKGVGGQMWMPWINEHWFAERGITDTAQDYLPGAGYLKETLLQLFNHTNLPMLLRFEDRNSMAFSIESRVPFLTPALAQFVFSLPDEYLIDDSALTKAVFREAMRGLVPDAVLDRRDKIGFATPEKQMLSAISPWVNTLLNSNVPGQVLPIRQNEANAEWQRVSQGARPFDFRIWRMLNMIKWADHHSVDFSS